MDNQELLLQIEKAAGKIHSVSQKENFAASTGKGLSEAVIRQISKDKNEPEWMLAKRLKAYEWYLKTPVPTWGLDLSDINFDEIVYYARPDAAQSKNWEEVPEEIRKTFDMLGIPETERKALAGAGAQYDSSVVYHNLKKEWEEKGVIFEDMDIAVQKYPELVKEYFMTRCIPISDHKLIMLHAAVWSGGCLTADTKVFTANPGVKSISEIKEGTEVFALDNNDRLTKSKVLAKIYSGKKDVYRIRVGGRTLEATGNHEFLCLEKSNEKLNSKGKRWRSLWKDLDHIKPGDLVAIAKKLPDFGISKELPPLMNYIKNHHKENNLGAPAKTDEELMWFLGLYLGDGNICFPNEHMCYINLAIPEKEESLRKEIVENIKRLFNYDIKTKNTQSITINSKALGYWLKELGFGGRANEKRIPDWVFGLPRNERLAFLGGLLDSDGWVEVYSNSVRFELANEELIKSIKLLGISCGLYSGGMTYNCRLSGNITEIKSRDLSEIRKLNKIGKCASDKYNASHGENFSSMTNEHLGFAPLIEKEPLGIKDVYDIQVENHHNFVANGIIAHNSFIYVPKDVKISMPLQAYFRMNAKRGGQFEHTLIIAEPGSEVSYIEGCSAPQYSSNSLHAGGVEIYVKEGARVRYSSVENWSKSTYNLNTKRAVVEKDGVIEWIGGNAGSKGTMLYPCSLLKGEGARADHLGIAYAGKGQNQDTGAKVYHLAKNTSSTIKMKSISAHGGATTYRGLVKISKGAANSKVSAVCDALIMDEESRSNTVPVMDVNEDKVEIAHEATVGRLSTEKIFYLMSRGLKEEEAVRLIVSGFIEPIMKELPMEYAVELNRLIQLDMTGAIG